MRSVENFHRKISVQKFSVSHTVAISLDFLVVKLDKVDGKFNSTHLIKLELAYLLEKPMVLHQLGTLLLSKESEWKWGIFFPPFLSDFLHFTDQAAVQRMLALTI